MLHRERNTASIFLHKTVLVIKSLVSEDVAKDIKNAQKPASAVPWHSVKKMTVHAQIKKNVPVLRLRKCAQMVLFASHRRAWRNAVDLHLLMRRCRAA
jgi:hypothetical protein